MQSGKHSLTHKLFRIAALSTIAVFCGTSSVVAGPGMPPGPGGRGPSPFGFTRFAPPRGLCVPHLPLGFETVMIAGITYFVFAGIYYQRAASGYVVVDPPPQQPAPAPTPTLTGTVLVVDTDLLNVRSGPGAEHEVINQVRKGMQFEVLDTAPGWKYIHVKGNMNGWVMEEYTHLLAPEAKG